MRISDWSSDVCSSDLHDRQADQHGGRDQESLAPHRSEGLSEAEIHLEAVVGIPWVEGKGEVGTDRPDRRVIAEAEAGGPLHLLGEIRTLVSVDLSGVDERHDPEIAVDPPAQLGTEFQQRPASERVRAGTSEERRDGTESVSTSSPR